MSEVMIKVDGKDVLCPSVFEWGLQDVSAADSGRTEDTQMQKEKIIEMIRKIDNTKYLRAIYTFVKKLLE